MYDKSYGITEKSSIASEADRHAEELLLKGYTIISDLFSSTELENWRQKIDTVYAQQEAEFGRENLAKIQETDMCRAPLLYDFDFIKVASQPRVIEVVARVLGDWFILNLQNAIINRPDKDHHQQSWHRDLPYQNWVISQPLAVNALFAIDDFTEETGGTFALPFTHKIELFPSQEYVENNQISVTMPAGSVVVFDSMMFHRAGDNKSNIIRRAINNLYTKPIFKQQYDFPRALGERDDLDGFTEKLLGYTSQVPVDDKQWRLNRANKSS